MFSQRVEDIKQKKGNSEGNADKDIQNKDRVESQTDPDGGSAILNHKGGCYQGKGCREGKAENDDRDDGHDDSDQAKSGKRTRQVFQIVGKGNVFHGSVNRIWQECNKQVSPV
jgi:hypothetical protein